MKEQPIITLKEQIEEKEKVLIDRAEIIRVMVQLQNKDRIELQRLIEIVLHLQKPFMAKDGNSIR